MRALLAIIIVALTASAGLAVADSEHLQAQTHHRSGQRLYAAGDYESAVLEFSKAYRLSGNPALLFNIGQAYRLAGECARARDYYQRYSDQEPRAAELTNVIERIAQMQRCIAQRSRAGEPARQEPASANDTEATESGEGPLAVASATPAPRQSELADAGADIPPLRARPGRGPISDGTTRRWSGGVTASAGVLLVGTGVLFWLRANDRAEELSTQFASGGEWTAEAEQLEDGVGRDRKLGTIATAVGGLAIVTGTYLLWSGRRQRDRSRQLALRPLVGGAELACSWSF